MEISFLSVEDVLHLHELQVRRWGGGLGVREMGLLESAVEAPRATFDGTFLNNDLFEMAASYLCSIVLNHPFVDGNKRAGTTAATTFLDLNDVRMTADEARFTDLVMRVAQGLANKSEVAEFFRANTRRV